MVTYKMFRYTELIMREEDTSSVMSQANPKDSYFNPIAVTTSNITLIYSRLASEHSFQHCVPKRCLFGCVMHLVNLMQMEAVLSTEILVSTYIIQKS
jgi:hypothetical protein